MPWQFFVFWAGLAILCAVALALNLKYAVEPEPVDCSPALDALEQLEAENE